MANFIAIIDPERDRREQFIKNTKSLLPICNGLITNSCQLNNFQASWAAHPSTPISLDVGFEGAAIIWGEAIKENESTRVQASELIKLWKVTSTKGLPCFDGFHAAVAYHPDFGIAVTADIFGTFPVYYYHHKEIILVGSSVELFKYHPLFKSVFNPSGLVGIFLTNSLFAGQTLWQDVRRIEAGSSLVWTNEIPLREVKQYETSQLEKNDAYTNLSFSEHLDILDRLLTNTLQRHTPVGQKYSLLLSGGLDSRMIAGILNRQKADVIALTLGKRSDLEIQCAIPVARTLGLEHKTITIPYTAYSNYADLQIKWEHLCNGFNWIMNWGICSESPNYASKIINGYLMDLVVGGKLPYYFSKKDELSFDKFFFAGVNRWGFTKEILEKLLNKKEFGDLVEETLNRIRTVYTNYSDIEFKRAWWFDLYHRQRFHVGSALWQISFGAWPVVPVLDMQVLKVTAAMPVETIANRKAQNELLCTRFPQLANLPLDRNDFNVEPLLKNKNYDSFARYYKLQRKWRQLQKKLGVERRYYYRIYDINNSGWRSVRQQAEPYREKTQHLFNQEILDVILPKYDVNVRSKIDAIPESSSIKALIGFLLWSRDNL